MTVSNDGIGFISVNPEFKSDSSAVEDRLQNYFPDFHAAIEAFVLDHRAYVEDFNP